MQGRLRRNEQMIPSIKYDQDLLDLFSQLITDENENRIFQIIFTNDDEDMMLEEIISRLEITNNDKV